MPGVLPLLKHTEAAKAFIDDYRARLGSDSPPVALELRARAAALAERRRQQARSGTAELVSQTCRWRAA